MSSNPVTNSILKTLAYAAVFDSCLTDKELFQFLISKKVFKKVHIQNQLQELIKTNRVGEVIQNDIVSYRLNYRSVSVENISRFKISQDKIKKTRKWKKWLYLIPWVQAVFITGSCAANNAKANDDVDILIITSNNRLWLARLFVASLLNILGIRRKPETKNPSQKKNFKDLVCANMYLDSTILKIIGEDQNLYLARELAQAKVVFDKQAILPGLWQKNLKIKKIVPHSPALKMNFAKINNPNLKESKLFNLVEKWAYRLQNIYMASKKTSEITNRHKALFHPRDTSSLVINKYHQIIKSVL